MAQRVLVASDLAWPLPVCLTPHTSLVAMAPMIVPTAEVPAPLAWPAGAATHRLAIRVVHRKQPVVQAGHDVGMGLVHVGAPPGPLDLIHTATSRRTVTFAAALVRAGGVPVGAGIPMIDPPAPMSACAEPSPLPIAGAPFALLNTVTIGLGAVALTQGWAAVVAEAAMALAMGPTAAMFGPIAPPSTLAAALFEASGLRAVVQPRPGTAACVTTCVVQPGAAIVSATAPPRRAATPADGDASPLRAMGEWLGPPRQDAR